MKRGKPLKRKTPLTADPKKVHEFVERGRGALSRSAPLKSRGGGFRRTSSAEGPLSPEAWRTAVFQASGGRCTISGSRASRVDDPRFHVHHPLAKQKLRARGLLGYVWDPRNAIWIRVDVHERHESAARRIAAEELPAAVWGFCTELDELAGTRWATDLVLRAHPPAGHSRVQ